MSREDLETDYSRIGRDSPGGLPTQRLGEINVSQVTISKRAKYVFLPTPLIVKNKRRRSH
jgi:hypothetical protein